MMIDLDGFKKVNDLYGHDSGDQLLREVADRMRDTVPPSSVLARLGGDEFGVCVVFEPEFPETVDRIAEDLIDILSVRSPSVTPITASPRQSASAGRKLTAIRSTC